MISIKEKHQCCGCSACVKTCPKHCIKFETDEEGFWYPVVNDTECVQCEMCNGVCPILNQEETDEFIQRGYAAYIKEDEIRFLSSSGGVFSVLAEYVLHSAGVVFGAAYDQNFMVHHIGIHEVKDLYKLRGSKYLQSRPETTYVEAKKLLEAGQTVLYSGTACQIAGLKKFLKKEYENLITIDVLCHGVPSPKVWEQYVLELKKQAHLPLVSVSFRAKNTGWKRYSVEFRFQDSKTIRHKLSMNPYMQLFLKNMCLRPSCHQCAFKSLHRCSDLSLGDAWGIEDYMPDMDDDKGTSIVLVHTAKGQTLFDRISGKLIYKEVEIDKILPKSSDSRHSVTAHLNRDKFFEELVNGKRIHQLADMVKPHLYIRIYYRLKREMKRIIKK